MKIRIFDDYEEMSQAAMRTLLSELLCTPNCRRNVSITAGKTPVRMYELLCPVLREMNLDYVHFYNFDEIPVRGRPPITMTALEELFFKPAAIPRENIHALTEENYQNYDALLESHGGLDYIILGIGLDGHFCGNLSGTVSHFGQQTRAVSTSITPTIEARLNFLSNGPENRMDYYVTFGPRTVMNSRKILVIANGTEKAEIISKILKGPVDVSVPASVLQLHPNVEFLLDKAAASLL